MSTTSSGGDDVDTSLAGGGFSPRVAYEQHPAHAFACPPVVAVALAVLGLVAVAIAAGAGDLGSGARIGGAAVAVGVALVGPGFVVVQPNESCVLIIFGRYVGTLDEARLW